MIRLAHVSAYITFVTGVSIGPQILHAATTAFLQAISRVHGLVFSGKKAAQPTSLSGAIGAMELKIESLYNYRPGLLSS